jgi:uncharacterized protein (DUF58 family)
MGVGLAVALVYALVSAVVRWIRLSRVEVRTPSHTFEVRHGCDREPVPALTVLGIYWADGGAAAVQLVSGSRSHTVMTRTGGESPGRIEIPCSAVPRGLYQLQQVTVRFIGLLSLFVVALEYTISEGSSAATPLLRVLPQSSFVGEPPLLAGFVSGPRSDESLWDRSDELIETRPYHPGDDTRRINWNAYAHSETLFVRIGEEIPPPTMNAEVMVDARGVDSFADEDQLISAALGVAEELARRGCAVIVSAQVDTGGPRTLGTIEEGRRALAAVDPIFGFLPDIGGPKPRAVNHAGGHALVVGTDRSPAAPAGMAPAILLWDRTRREGGGHVRTLSLLA